MTPIGCHRQKNQSLAASKPFAVSSLRLVPMVTNDTNGNIYSGTNGKTPNATIVSDGIESPFRKASIIVHRCVFGLYFMNPISACFLLFK